MERTLYFCSFRQTTATLAGHEKLDTCRPQNVIGQVGHKNFDSFSHRRGHSV